MRQITPYGFQIFWWPVEMSRTPAKFTQADIARALKAVQQVGVDMQVRLLPDGSIVIAKGQAPDAIPDQPLDARPEFRL